MLLLLTKELQITSKMKSDTQYIKNLLECKRVEFKSVNYTKESTINLSVKTNSENEIVFPQLLRQIAQEENESKIIWVYFCDRENIDELNDNDEFSELRFKTMLCGTGKNEAYYKNTSATYFKDIQRLNVQNNQKEIQNAKLLQEIKDLHVQIDMLEGSKSTEDDFDNLQNELKKYKTENFELKTQKEYLELELKHNSRNDELKCENEMLKLQIKQVENEKVDLCKKSEELSVLLSTKKNTEDELRLHIQEKDMTIEQLIMDNKNQYVDLKKQNTECILNMYLQANNKEKDLLTNIQKILCT